MYEGEEEMTQSSTLMTNPKGNFIFWIEERKIEYLRAKMLLSSLLNFELGNWD